MVNKRQPGRDPYQWQKAQMREADRARRAADRTAAADAREQQRRYIEGRIAEAAALTDDLERRVGSLTRILADGIRRPAVLDLRQFLRSMPDLRFDPGPLRDPETRPAWTAFEPSPPGSLAKIFGGAARHEKELAQARADFSRAESEWQRRESDRVRKLSELRAGYERDHTELADRIERHNNGVRAEMAALRERDRPAVERYLEQVLARLPIPEDFPRRAEVAFNPDTGQAVIQLQLPGTGVIPQEKSYRYLQSGPNKDTMPVAKRPEKEIKQLYRDVIAQVTLLAVRDAFDADEQLRHIGFNGHVDAVNPATGQAEYPCLISLSVERETFAELVLDRVSPVDCLRHLRAIVSEHPYALVPIRPILDFDLSKFNFIEGLDVVSTLDHRPDLMDMGHGEFEHLVVQICEARGMQGWTTTSSNDDGVDGVVMNPDPFVGGVTIVQAKHYKKVVGVNHIRELAGAMEEKRAGRGILVTTSWFTAGGWQKSKEHGRMQLIDGQHLTYLIKKYLGKDVVIGVNRPRRAPSGTFVEPEGDED